ncbi:glycoside hydrolase family 97 protein [Spirosoma sp. KUDC1026]|uniref:glycoside hydrolase family 97 protein n=1 Tax=Spirosoma sp. KUDC1026 TaxID=2745947 RepID=UPI00159B9CA4|nr:glycoside hydrolase family 97 protein [Spirosoma sp. KUDC1026]QKZ14162.1 glycoside hydrolase family 97 catalytic domain-containing protein [Spirosoma sp. KUDC1026]
MKESVYQDRKPNKFRSRSSWLALAALGLLLGGAARTYAQSTYTISSPDKQIVATCDPARLTYAVSYKGESVLAPSALGLVREDADFSEGLKLLRVSAPTTITDNYTMVNAKKKNIRYTATQRTVETQTAGGQRMNIVFRVSNDGLAFRYEFPDRSTDVKKITAEATTFHFNEGTRAWMQEKTEAQSGFEHSNPSYEAHYKMDIPVGTPAPGKNGWIYPALFRHNQTWVMLTEADLGRHYCGTALQQQSPGGEYRINFPQTPEKIENGALNPESTLPWQTPWRILVVGNLKTVMESTLGTDLARPARKMDASFIKPGKASWSWVLEKDGATVYPVQKKYVDYAADMHWQYCLIDANWDKSIGYDSVKVLADYAKTKGVGMLLWYNSAGSWNTVPFTPRNKLLTHESRVQEFARLRDMGIKGIKIDFFGGDGQSMINYYEDILTDAAAYQILINFHGATLPRGLARTYPNLMTTEAVHGYEMITFSQQTANAAPAHMINCAMIRNAFDPMDFTPMCLYKIPRIKRATTPAFELATSVLFLSGIQHFAETADGMTHVPADVKEFLRQLPNSWDDVRFIDGEPGKQLIIARKTGNKWYVAGVNGEKTDKALSVDLSFLKNRKGRVFTSVPSDSDNPAFDVRAMTVPANGIMPVQLTGNDGFVAVFE